MGRLDDIIERNRNPRGALRQAKGRRGVGLAGVVLFVVLILLIFTDLARSPDAPPAPGPRAPTAAPHDRVRDIYLASPRARPPVRDAGVKVAP